MNKIAKERLNKNLRQSIKYLTLVFNDFFILALIFLFGALMFWYAQAMKTMPANLWFYKPLLGVLLWLPLLTGHLVTLIKEADIQFLFTQDKKMQEYFKPLYRYSLILPWLLEILLAGVLFPFATIKANFSVINFIFLTIAMLIIKAGQLELEEQNLYFGKRYADWMTNLMALILAVLGVYIPIFILFISCIRYWSYYRLLKTKRKQLFDWRYAIESERTRKDRVYSLFSMFTDVSEKQVTIKRRKYLDFLLPKSLANENPNRFLYRRSLLRNPDYLNLLVRMTAFAVLISWLVSDWRWALGLSCLVIFLTVYQLMPLATEFDDNIMYRVYPIIRTNRGRDLVRIVSRALMLQTVIIGICWLIVLPINFDWLEAFVALIAFTIAISSWYLPYRVKRMEVKR